MNGARCFYGWNNRVHSGRNLLKASQDAREDSFFSGFRAVLEGNRYFCVSSDRTDVKLRMDSGIKRLYYGQFGFEAICHGLLTRGTGSNEHFRPVRRAIAAAFWLFCRILKRNRVTWSC